MAFVIRHTPVAALGRLALAAGRAQGRQAQASRDLQFVSMADAASDRAAAIGLNAQSQDRAFTFQQAAAEQVAARRPVTVDTTTQRQTLNQTIAAAKKTGVYSSTQIKQMKLFATLGDEGSVRAILRQPPRPAAKTAAQKERAQQTEALGITTRNALAPLQQELVDVNQQISERYQGEEIQRLIESGRVSIPEADREKFEGLFAKRRELNTRIETVRQESDQVQGQLDRGFSIPAQEAARIRKTNKEQRLKAERARNIEGRKQRFLNRQIDQLTKEMKIDKFADPAVEQTRVKGLQTRIDALHKKLLASHDRLDAALGGTILSTRQSKLGEQTDADALIAETLGDPATAMRRAKESGLVK